MGCYTNLNWFSRRILDINNMPPKKRTVFFEVSRPSIPTLWMCEMCFFCWCLLSFMSFSGAEIPSLKQNIFRNLKKWMAYFWKTFFVFLFGKPGFLEGYLNPTPRRPKARSIQATGGLSQITWAMPNEAVNPVPLKKRNVGSKLRLWKGQLKSHMISMPCINQYCTWFCNGVCVYISSVCI